ncbi:MAG: sulfatase [Thermoanaerobaculia bacterium]|nr:sulfatase [Thermoanaerobaculia bacterium]
MNQTNGNHTKPSPTREVRPALAVLFVCGAGLLLGAGAGSRVGESVRAPRWNVVLLMADTLRADHLSAYGYERETSPWLDRFAETEAVLFESAFSQAACTFPSVNSLLTSRYPQVFLGREDRSQGIPPEVPSLADLLRDEGYSTAAVSASPIVRATPSKHNPTAGFGRGFDTFHEDCHWRSASCVTRAALDRLEDLTEPFFLYLHYMDPHSLYALPADAEPRFSGPYEGLDYIEAGDPNPIEAALYKEKREPEVEERDIQHLVDLYDDSIRYMDRWWSVLVEELKSRGVWDRTIVLIVGDHGEELMERGHMGHCRTLSDAILRTPLVIRVPGVEGGRRVDGVVQNLDLVPTVLELLGVRGRGEELEGRSLVDAIHGEGLAPDERYTFAWQAWQRSVRDGRYKLVRGIGGGPPRLFDLTSDPLELKDVSEEHREILRRLGRRLVQWRRLHEGSREEAAKAGQEAMDQLKAVGYLQ